MFLKEQKITTKSCISFVFRLSQSSEIALQR